MSLASLLLLLGPGPPSSAGQHGRSVPSKTHFRTFQYQGYLHPFSLGIDVLELLTTKLATHLIVRPVSVDDLTREGRDCVS